MALTLRDPDPHAVTAASPTAAFLGLVIVIWPSCWVLVLSHLPTFSTFRVVIIAL